MATGKWQKCCTSAIFQLLSKAVRGELFHVKLLCVGGGEVIEPKLGCPLSTMGTGSPQFVWLWTWVW